MSGLKFLVISREGKVYPIPIPKGPTYNAVPELANQQALVVDLFYETQNRKPWRLLHIGYDRIELDEHGQQTSEDLERHKKLYNFNNFGICTVEQLSKRRGPFSIPEAPDIPTKVEKDALRTYIKQKYPVLWENSPYAIENSIKSRIDTHSELISMVKKASLLRRKRKKT